MESASVEAFMEASVETSMKVASTEAFMEASTEAASMEASADVFVEASGRKISMEASVLPCRLPSLLSKLPWTSTKKTNSAGDRLT